jgi:hypothetical protein
MITKTHSAVRRFGRGSTADKWLGWHVGNARGGLPDVLIIEELSLLGLNLWTDVCTAFISGRAHKEQFILADDLFQLQPPKNTWCGAPVHKHALKNSDLLYQLAGGTRVFLNRNVRSDTVIYQFAMSLRADGIEFSERLAQAKALFPSTDRVPDTVLVLSHAKRELYNTEINLKKKPDDAIFLERTKRRSKDDCRAQDMWIWKGMIVLGQEKPCFKSQLYKVMDWDNNKVTLETVEFTQVNGEIPEGKTLEVCRHTATDAIRMMHAVTYCRSQGLTLQGVIVLADTDSQHFEIEHLNLGLTRGTHSSLVEIRDC